MTDRLLLLPPEMLAAVVDKLELRTTSFVGLRLLPIISRRVLYSPGHFLILQTASKAIQAAVLGVGSVRTLAQPVQSPFPHRYQQPTVDGAWCSSLPI